jgi:tRNA modification GTPase
LILVLNDISHGEAHSNPLLDSLRMKFPDAECTLVQTKIDIANISPNASNDALLISVVSEKGMPELKQFIAHKAQSAVQTVSDALINARQAALLAHAASSLVKAKEAVVAGASNEFAAIDLRDALKRIGEITGEVWNEEILNSVFAKFCIGK